MHPEAMSRTARSDIQRPGLLGIYARSWPTAILVGVAIALPLMLCAYTVKYGPPWRWDSKPWITTGITAGLSGAMGAKLFFKLGKLRE